MLNCPIGSPSWKLFEAVPISPRTSNLLPIQQLQSTTSGGMREFPFCPPQSRGLSTSKMPASNAAAILLLTNFPPRESWRKVWRKVLEESIGGGITTPKSIVLLWKWETLEAGFAAERRRCVQYEVVLYSVPSTRGGAVRRP